jgi:metallo-beta-lactamase family protein
MRVTLFGAAGEEVTGSAYYLETDEARVLVDFGLFQGRAMAEAHNRVPRNLKPNRLDAVLLTHAHLDHCGRLPLLAKQGYEGPIVSTPASLEMADLILRDAAKIQQHDLERANRKRERAGQRPKEPMYTSEDVTKTVRQFRAVPYDQLAAVAPGIQARFVEAGHILGSACIELTVRDGGRDRVVVFSGDVGQWGAPILRDPARLDRADVVFMESTYGDRDHRPLAETVEEFTQILKTMIARRGKLLVPAFAIGRTQQLLYHLAILFRNNTIPKFPVFIDSPMAIEASEIYLRHPELADEEVQALRAQKPLLEDLDTVQGTATADQSKALNHVAGPCLILAGAGMCNAGRILHHLKYNLWRPETSVAIVGYQAPGSLGRRLVEGARVVSIFGEKVVVRANVHTLGGFSAHAGQSDLLRWFEPLAAAHPRVFLTHGEARARQPLAQLLRERYTLTAEMPGLEQTVVL